MPRFWLFVLLLLTFHGVASAQGSIADAGENGSAGKSASVQDQPRGLWAARREAGPETLHYVVAASTSLYSDAEMKKKAANLSRRDPVYVLRQEGEHAFVRTKGGVEGYVKRSEVSNVWIRVSKGRGTLYLFRGPELLREIPVDLGFNTFADKERRGSEQNKDDWRTPEGAFFVVDKNARSQFYKAFVLNYPTIQHAQRGLKANLISMDEYARIVRAENATQVPPMNTALGGMIEIHGRGTGARANWTQGCVAVSDQVMDDLWNLVELGTPVLIED